MKIMQLIERMRKTEFKNFTLPLQICMMVGFRTFQSMASIYQGALASKAEPDSP